MDLAKIFSKYKGSTLGTGAISTEDFIFGCKTDFICFLLPAFCCVIFAIAGQLLSQEIFQSLENFTILICIVFLDRAHTFATFYRLILNNADRNTYGRQALFLAALCGVAFTWLHQQSSQLFWQVATYLAVWHVLRQHVGFALYAEDKAKVVTGFGERLFATAHLYLLWVGTFMGLHASPTHTLGWYTNEDLFKVPESFRSVGMCLSLAGIWAYVLWSLYRYFTVRKISKPSLLVWFSSLFASGVLWLVDPAQNRIMIVLALSLLHSIPYLAASAKAFNAKDMLVSGFSSRFSQCLLPGSLLLLATLIIGAAWQLGAMASLASLRSNSANKSNTEALALFVSVAETFFMLPVIVHNLIDGRLWKRSKNPSSLRKFIVGAKGT